MTRRLALATLAIVALIAGGFGLAVSSLAQPHATSPLSSDSMAGMDMSEGPVVVSPSAGATITIANFAFTGTFTVAPGSTVSVKNSDATTHTLTANGGAFNTGNIAAGVTTTFTAPTTPGAYPFHCAIHSSMTGTLTVSAPASLTVPALTKHALVQTAYSATATASGGTAPYTFSVSGGTLPPGITMTAAGAIAGRATTAGTFSFTLNAADSAGAHGSVATSIVVDPMAITTKALPATGVLDAYSLTLKRRGGKGTFTWSVSSGSLPTGITLSAVGVLSGAAQCVTPTASCAVGSSTFTVQVVDHGSPVNLAQTTFTLKVLAEKITTATLPGGVVGQAYPATQLTKIGGGSAVTWVVASGQLPPGLVLSPSGQVSGTPTASGSFIAHIRVQPSTAGVTTPTATKTFTIAITAP